MATSPRAKQLCARLARNGGGLYNATANYSFNPSPDFVAKVVLRTGGWGHYEAFGMVRDFRDRIFPCGGVITATNGVLPPAIPCGSGNFPNASGAFNNSGSAWALASTRAPRVSGKIDVGVHSSRAMALGVMARLVFRTCGASRRSAGPGPQLSGSGDPGVAFQATGCLRECGRRVRRPDGLSRLEGKGAGYGSTLFNNSGLLYRGSAQSHGDQRRYASIPTSTKFLPAVELCPARVQRERR